MSMEDELRRNTKTNEEVAEAERRRKENEYDILSRKLTKAAEYFVGRFTIRCREKANNGYRSATYIIEKFHILYDGFRPDEFKGIQYFGDRSFSSNDDLIPFDYGLILKEKLQVELKRRGYNNAKVIYYKSGHVHYHAPKRKSIFSKLFDTGSTYTKEEHQYSAPDRNDKNTMLITVEW